MLVTWPDYDVTGLRDGGALVAAGLQPRLAPKLGARSASEVLKLVDGAVGAIVSTDPFDANVLSKARSLRVIARVGVGVDSIDLEAATANRVFVTITPGANEIAVAEHTVALMLAAQRRLCEHDAAVRKGYWRRTGADTPWLLSDAIVGLVGYGRIGKLVAERLRAFHIRILVSDPIEVAADGVEPTTLDTLLATADIVSLHTPLLSTTRNLIGPAELQRMRPGAVLVNTARGGIVDERALHQALTTGTLRAAALDVFADEPPHGSPLLDLPNVILSPHNAGLSTRTIAEMTARATASVVDVVVGRVPEHLANPEVAENATLARG